jgi:hypothetical protein
MRRTILVIMMAVVALALSTVRAQDANPEKPDAAASAQQSRLFVTSELARIARGFEIAPVRLDLAGKNPLRVGLGSYLVNAAGGCNDCHTNPPFAPGGNPFQGEPKRINADHYLRAAWPSGPSSRAISRRTPRPVGRPASASSSSVS